VEYYYSSFSYADVLTVVTTRWQCKLQDNES